MQGCCTLFQHSRKSRVPGAPGLDLETWEFKKSSRALLSGHSEPKDLHFIE
jgi:hypothetical protein